MNNNLSKDISPEIYLKLFREILKIRRVELKIEELYHEDEMKTPVHLSLGQEAAAVGVCAHLTEKDYIFSNHRSHAHYIAKGGNLKAMIAELYCKETGCSKGRGGSMHLIDTSVGHLGSSSIVGGSIPHAVGAAFASVVGKKGAISVSFFGDAASEQGVLYESMNWAALKKLPVIFVCENNKYSVCSHISVRQANGDVSMRPRAFDIPSLKIDGMDIVDVYEKAQQAVEHVRSGKGPFFLECCVQRWRGHAGAGDTIREQYRQPEDLDEKNKRDPLADLENLLLENNVIEKSVLERVVSEIEMEVQEAFDFAQQSPLPKKEDVEKYLFS